MELMLTVAALAAVGLFSGAVCALLVILRDEKIDARHSRAGLLNLKR